MGPHGMRTASLSLAPTPQADDCNLRQAGETDETGERILRVARFDPRLKTYYLLVSLFGFAVTIVGIPLAILWAIFGPAIHKRQYEAMECELTERSLNFRKGFLFRVQKNVPLDKITDLALNEGPILRYLGLCSLTVETAGGGAGTATGQAALVGITDALEFRNAVLRQRDLVTDRGHGRAAQPASPAPETSQTVLLTEIRDSLARIESEIAKRNTTS
jgi:putative membrane protein